MEPSSDQPTILSALHDHVLLVTFNRPERLSATVPETVQLHMRTLLEAAENPVVRAIVLTGAGRAFCAGADISLVGGLAERDIRPEKLRRHWFLKGFPKPAIAAINGPLRRPGLVIAMMCDIRVARCETDRAVFSDGTGRRKRH